MKSEVSFSSGFSPVTSLADSRNIVVGDVTFYYDNNQEVYRLPNGVVTGNAIRARRIAHELNKSVQRYKNVKA